MRVLVYNVRGFKSGVRGVADAVRELRPDVGLITECGTRRKLHRFADAMQMRPFHGPLPPILRRVRNAILVRDPLPVGRWGLERFEDSKRFFPRGALFAELSEGGKRIWAVSVHLGLRRGERLRHAGELAALARRLGHPLMIGGDLNEPPGGGAVATVSRVGSDAWTEGGGETFPAAGPLARIDYLFVSPEVEVRKRFLADGPAAKTASDHLAVVFDLEF